MSAFPEYFVHSAIPPAVPSSSSLKCDFGHYRRFNNNVAYVHFCCSSTGSIQQCPDLFADYFAGTFIPISNIWPYGYYHCSTNPKREFCQQPAATQCWQSDAPLLTASLIPGTSVHVTEPKLDKQRDISPFSSGTSRSSSTASSDYTDSTTSGIGHQDNYYEREESRNFHIAVASSSDTSSYSPPQISSLRVSSFENSDHNIAGASPLANYCCYDCAATGFYPQKQSQSTGLRAQAPLDVLVTAYSTHFSAMKFYNLRRRNLARKRNGLSAGNLRFETGAGFENVAPTAACFHVYHPSAACFVACQSPSRFLPLETIESYIHYLERYATHEF